MMVLVSPSRTRGDWGSVMTHANVETLRRVDEAMLKQDLETFFAQHTDDVTAHVGGRNKLSGTYRGLDKFRDMFGRFMEAAGDYSFENHTYLADDEHGVTMQRGTFTRGGKTFTTNEVFICHFRDGKVSEIWYLPGDQAGLDAWIGR
jgi:ketosteroid isomerase-like protein